MKVCVVGSGPSGLTTIKQLLDEGHDVTCFEKNENVGGIWYRNGKDDDQMKVFDNLILTISRKLMAFSDFMVEGERRFFTHKEYFQYLEAYADKFGLRERISFGSTVDDVRKTPDGSWHVTVTPKDGARAVHVFQAIAVCSGPFQSPCMNVKDLEKFTGEVVHSSRYRNNLRFRGKRVLVVGLAESGADVLREISDVASECTLAIRSYSFLLPRLHFGRHATDELTVRAHHYEMMRTGEAREYPRRSFIGDHVASRSIFSACTKLYGAAMLVSNAASKILERAAPPQPENKLGEPMYPLKVDVGTEWTREIIDAIDEWNRRSHNYEGSWIQKIIFCKNVSFIPNIVSGKIKVNDSGIERIQGNRAYFKDNTSAELDTIVLCTGFNKDFSVLGGELKVKDNNVRNLYKHAFHPDHDGRLAFIGFVRPFSGGIPICAEMQARYFAQLCSDKVKLPIDLADAIEQEKVWEERATELSPRHTESVPSQILFLDSIAKEIGCLMPIHELILNPWLLIRQWFYPFNQSCYRLVGPHNLYESARRSLLDEDIAHWAQPIPAFFLMVSSFLPRSIHPRDLGFGTPVIMPQPPDTSPERVHFLSRGAWRAHSY